MTLQRLNHLSPDGGKRIPEAEEAYRGALLQVTAPEARVQLRGNLGALLMAANRVDDALAEMDLALEDGKGVPHQLLAGLSFNRAKALTMLGKIQEADAAYLAASAAGYGHDLSSYSKALAAMSSAAPPEHISRAEAVAAAARAVLAPSLPFLLDTPSSLPHGGTTPHKLGAGAGWLQGVHAEDVSWLHFALFNAHHQRRQYESAWAFLEVANKLMRSKVQYNVADELRTLQQVMSIFSGPLYGYGYKDRTPVFIVGLPRSGSTLVEQMLASHPDVWAAGEDTALAPLTAEVNTALSTPNIDQAAALEQFGKRYVQSMQNLVPAGLFPAEHPPARIVDKMLHSLWLVGYIALLLPSSCVLHVVRHPLDAGLSCYSQPFGYSGVPWAWDLDEIAAQINMTWRLADHWDTIMPGRVMTVHYEALVAHPEAVARSVLSYCNLPWHDAVLRFHDTARPVATASMAQVRRPLYNTSVERWRAYEQQIQPLLQALGGAVEQYERRLEKALAAGAAAEDALQPSEGVAHEEL